MATKRGRKRGRGAGEVAAGKLPASLAMSAGWGAPTRSNLKPAFFSMKGMRPSFFLSTSVNEIPVHPALI